ncbi:MAG: DUF5103 domain-containing protein [Muribaculaceae bacterium]|nr:DUF5103 domain-containing protein [Muribaculaceae bacterium]
MVRRLLTYTIAVIAAALTVCRAADTATGILAPGFATLQVYADDNELTDAVIRLDDDRHITIEFDELADDVRYMRYSLIHCNADWQPSQLVDSEFLDGFNEGTVDDYEFSRATTVHYVHYRITIPGESMRPLVSGNYLLRVYDEGEPDVTLLQARFMITEQSVTLSSCVSSVTDIDYNDAHQQLSIELDATNLTVHDPFNDFKVVVTQNNRPDTRRTLLHPLRMQGSRLVYEHLPKLIFAAGNEYRRFENISTHSPSMHVEGVAYHGPYYHAYLQADESRAAVPYTYDRTQNGGYVVREYNSTRPDSEADYLVTHFTLLSDPLPGTDIYIDGDLTDRRMDSGSRLTYDSELGAYTITRLLKQGSYNYMYLAVPSSAPSRGTAVPSATSAIEGDFYNTVNKYDIAIYHRLPGQRYDRLVGYFTVYSL